MKEGADKPSLTKLHTVLFLLLVLASFFIGTLWTKVQYLEKGGSPAAAGKNTGEVLNNDNAAPAEEQIGDLPKITKDDKVKGNRNAAIALIEYSDLECPYCKQFHPTAQRAVDTYGDKIMWVYRHFPLSFHANAQKEAEATECAYELGGNDAFWKYVDTIMGRTNAGGTGFALDALVPLAKELGLNEGKFKTCLDSGKYTKKVADEMAGGSAAGVSGTPGNIILNTKTGEKKALPGAVPFESLKSAIDSMLK